MKATIFASLLLSVSVAVALAVPTARASNDTSGAAYFLTNGPTGNYIVSGDIASDGSLTLRNAFCTEGTGGHGTSAGGAAMSPDALFSQGAVRVSQAHKFLVTVNPGSNSIAAFSIDQSTPSNLKLVGSPMESGGEFPISVAINNAGDLVCALNGGAVSGIKCFKMDLTTGLTPLENSTRILPLNQTTPPVGPPGTLGDIQFSEDNTKLFASVKGNPNTAVGVLVAWSVGQDYTLSENFTAMAPGPGGVLPFSITVIPGNEALLVADPAVGFEIFDISNSMRNALSVVPVEGQTSICWSVRSPKTGNYYLTDTAGGAMFEVAVDDSLKGSVVQRYPQQVASTPTDLDVAVIGDQNYLYILQPNATQITVMSLPEAGKTEMIQEVDIAAFAASTNLTVVSYNLQGMATYVV